MTDGKIFDDLWKVICERAESKSTEKSYVRKLLNHEKGLDKPLEKVGEETTEFILACKNGIEDRIVEEGADAIFHIMVAMKAVNVDFSKIEEELAIRRQGMHLHD